MEQLPTPFAVGLQLLEHAKESSLANSDLVRTGCAGSRL